MLATRLALFLAILAFSSPVSAFELTPMAISHAQAPQNIDILGVRLGEHALDAEEKLLRRGYKTDRNVVTSKKFPCKDGVCVSYQGYSSYAWILYFEKDQERVSVYVAPPYAGSIVLRVNREINYRGRILPSFENLFQDARPKFGRSVTWNKPEAACWDFRRGVLIDPPELNHRKACDSTPMHRTVSDGFLYMVRDASDQKVTYDMVDKVSEQQIEEHVQNQLLSEGRKRKDTFQQKMDNAETPDL